jgi:glutamate-ammonia-ligase adenylyltransferase
MPEDNIENLIRDLPDADSARRFLAELAVRFPTEEKRLLRNAALKSDVLTLVSFSPLLATTLLRHKSYLAWLERQRVSAKVRGKEDLLESLARFALTNSTLEAHDLLSRFRRRELLRIYLQDIRNLETIAEITEEISNLADAILEYALRIARQELDNRFGAPLETDEKGRSAEATFCIVALGKLGSRELNYSSDIDLLFLYSSEGNTSGNGSRGAVTNREYFVKLAEQIIKIVGEQTGEGAAYRVDMRLRPHGRVGALAIASAEAAQYYLAAARPWERQVLIRSRACAGDPELFKSFASRVESGVFAKGESVSEALRNVRLSKEQINFNKQASAGFDVKLGRGGIREIEFIAQALQLAHGGDDEWLRVPHTLISLSRLADRGLIGETEHAQLADAYAFLRRLEHRLQMEHGLQTHLLPDDPDRRLVIAKRMHFAALPNFEAELERHTMSVSRAFVRVFGESSADLPEIEPASAIRAAESNNTNPAFGAALSSLQKSGVETAGATIEILRNLARISPHFAGSVAANPDLVKVLPAARQGLPKRDYKKALLDSVQQQPDFALRLAIVRRHHARFMLEIAVAEIFGQLTIAEAKRSQTDLAGASIAASIAITRDELAGRIGRKIDEFPFAVLGLGKLGGDSMDYGSDLDLVLVYDDEIKLNFLDGIELTRASVFGKAVEIFVTAMSAMTRDGSLYRVDLRLRPDGKNGLPATGRSAFLSYFELRSEIWEWLAFVKMRGVAGDLALARSIAKDTASIIHRRAQLIDKEELRVETKRVREMLESQKAGRQHRETDIKYGSGGMLDVYFAMRYLQLRDNIPDDPTDRSTVRGLQKLFELGSLRADQYAALSTGYAFLADLDHELRLTIGRSTKFPAANRGLLEIIAERLNLESAAEVAELLTGHRLAVRSAFEQIVG